MIPVGRFASVALTLLLTAWPAVAQQRWALGSSSADVAAIQGKPDVVERLASLRFEAWRYGESWIRFDFQSKRVISWKDAGNLKVAPDSSAAPSPKLPSTSKRPMPSAPPSLSATATFGDENDDGLLDADERATISLIVRNVGAGTAYDVTPEATTSAHGVSVVSSTRADSILPGRSALVRVVVRAAPNVTDQSVRLIVGARETNGFDLETPVAISVSARAFRPARLVVDGIAIADQSGNGRIEPREIVDVVVRIANRGDGIARDLRADVTVGANVLLTPESPRRIVLGTLKPGETRDVRFSAFANSRADSFPVTLELTGVKVASRIALPLTIDKPIAATPDLVVRGRSPSVPTASPPLVVDVDTGVPRGVPRSTVAVVLGVERYQRAPSVPYAKRDAAVFREYAEHLFGATNDANRLLLRTDDEVTGGELRKIFGDGGWLARRASAETDVVVYFAGHGVADLKSHAPYILPNDADPNYPAQTGFALGELYERLAALTARSVTVFIDACFSGGTRDGSTLFSGARDVVVSVEHPALRSESMSVFTASGASELANAVDDRRHGLFTYWLLRGLRGDADTSGDRAVSVAELDAYLKQRVPPDAARQDREQHPGVVSRNKDRIVVKLRERE